MPECVYVCWLPFGGVAMTAAELSEFAAVPDNQGLAFRVEIAYSEEEHECDPEDRAAYLFTQIMAAP